MMGKISWLSTSTPFHATVITTHPAEQKKIEEKKKKKNERNDPIRG